MRHDLRSQLHIKAPRFDFIFLSCSYCLSWYVITVVFVYQHPITSYCSLGVYVNKKKKAFILNLLCSTCRSQA